MEIHQTEGEARCENWHFPFRLGCYIYENVQRRNLLNALIFFFLSFFGGGEDWEFYPEVLYH